jgi:hypothetical protein
MHGSRSSAEVDHEGLAAGSQPGLRLGHSPHPPASCLTGAQAGAAIGPAGFEWVEPLAVTLQISLHPRMQCSDLPGQVTDAHARGRQRPGDKQSSRWCQAVRRSPITGVRVRSIRSRHRWVASRLSWRATRSITSRAAGASSSVRIGPREFAQRRYSHTSWSVGSVTPTRGVAGPPEAGRTAGAGALPPRTGGG